MSTEFKNLSFHQGKCLVAMPQKNPDPFFNKSVIYVCMESDKGIMGVIINKPIRKLQFSEILSELKLNIPFRKEASTLPIMRGGPLESGMGFILHSPEYENRHTVKISPFSAMTATIDVIKDIANGNPPKQHLIALGYAGWEQGQLEEEMGNNLWLTVPATPELLFDVPFQSRWSHALRQAGIDPLRLSSFPGLA